MHTQVVTCGRDSVRVYRLKDRQLKGISVRLGPPDKRVSAGVASLPQLLIEGQRD